MFQIGLSVAAVIGALAVTQPVFADPADPAAPDRVRAAEPVAARTTPPAVARSASPDRSEPNRINQERDVPVGFGWG